MPTNQKLINEYTGELTLTENGEACIVRFQGSSPSIVQQLISYCLEGRGMIRGTEVFSEDHFDGKKSIGWIGTVEVPSALGVKVSTEHRLQLLQKAA